MQLPHLKLSKKLSDKTIVGLEIEAGSVAAAQVRINGSSVLTGTAIAPLPPGAFHDGEVVDPEVIAATVKQVFTENGLSPRVRLGVANQRVVVRTLRLPAIEDPKELAAAVRFEAEEQIPMPLEQAVLDYRVIGGSGPTEEEGGAKVDVVVVAARRDMITASLQPLRDAGLEPVGVDLSAFGLIRALGEPVASDQDVPPATILYCNIGDSTNLAVARGRSCLFTRVAPAGLEDIATSLTGSTGLTPDHARLWLSYVGLARPLEELEGDANLLAQVRSTLEGGVSSLLDELRLSLDFYGAQEGAAPVEHIVFGGPGSAIPGLVDRMAPVLGLPVEMRAPAALGGFDPTAAARLTLSYGLALEA